MVFVVEPFSWVLFVAFQLTVRNSASYTKILMPLLSILFMRIKQVILLRQLVREMLYLLVTTGFSRGKMNQFISI
jgi:hypothetical protein